MPNLIDLRLKGTGPKPSGRSPVPIPEFAEVCDYCGTPFYIGELGPGTRIEMVCKRHGCKGYKVAVPILIPNCSKNNSAHDELRDNDRQQAPRDGATEVGHG